MVFSYLIRKTFRTGLLSGLLFIAGIWWAPAAYGQLPGLIVNEISNGASGSEEYMEFLAIGCPGTTIDLRGYIIDDNNGTFNSGGAGSGVGIATGHYRFTSISTWAAVPVGSLILVYNPDDKNRSIRLPNDPTDANQDKVYVIPANSSVLQVCLTNPNTTTTGYFCTYAPGLPAGTLAWSPLGMSNTADAGQVRNPNGTYFHGISYGNAPMNGGPDGLHFSGSGSEKVFSFKDGSFRQIGNFTSGLAPADETPGAPNNPANQTYITNLRSPFSAGTIGPDQNLCVGADPVAITQQTPPVGNGPFTYQWESSVTSATIGFTAIPGATAATYDPPVLQQNTWFRRRTSVAGCAVGFTNVVAITHTPVPAVIPSATDLIICSNQHALISMSSNMPGASFIWTVSNPDGNVTGAYAGLGNTINQPLYSSIGGLHTVIYSVSAVLNGCVSDPVNITVKVDHLIIEAGPDVTIPAGGQTVLQGSGGGNYTWFPATGLDDPHSANPVASPDQTTTYTLVSVSPVSNCLFGYDSMTVFVQGQLRIPNIITPNNDQVNDRFTVKGLIKGSSLKVFNRWGLQVYQSGSYSNDWSGDDLPDGIYYYLLTDPLKRPFKGWVEIVR